MDTEQQKSTPEKQVETKAKETGGKTLVSVIGFLALTVVMIIIALTAYYIMNDSGEFMANTGDLAEKATSAETYLNIVAAAPILLLIIAIMSVLSFIALLFISEKLTAIREAIEAGYETEE